MPTALKESKLVLPLHTLRSALSATTPAVERRPAAPVLGMIRIEPYAGGVELTTTSRVMSVRTRRKVAGIEAGKAVLLPALKLESYVRLLEGETATIISSERKHASLRCGGARARLPVAPETSFPHVEVAPSEKPISLRKDALDRMLRSTIFAVGQELGGALLEIGDGRLYLVATNGHRLARYSIPMAGEKRAVLLPERMLAALGRSATSGPDGACSFSTSENTVFAFLSDAEAATELAHKRAAGTFPNYRSILPTKAEASVRVDAHQLATAVRRCLTFADSKSQVVVLTISPTAIALHASEAGTGDTDDTVQVSSGFQFPPLRVAFRGEYLLDALTRVSGTVTAAFPKVAGREALWLLDRPANGEEFEYILMGINC